MASSACPKWMRFLFALDKFTATETSQVCNCLRDNPREEDMAEGLAADDNEEMMVKYFRSVLATAQATAQASERLSQETHEMRLREIELIQMERELIQMETARIQMETARIQMEKARIQIKREQIQMEKARIQIKREQIQMEKAREDRKMKELHLEELRLENERERSDWITGLLQLSYSSVGNKSVFSLPHFSPADPSVLHRIQELFDNTLPNWYEGIQVQHLRGNRPVKISDIVPKPGNQVVKVDESSADTKVGDYAAFGYTVALVVKSAAKALGMQVESIDIIIEKPTTTILWGRKQFLDCQIVLRLKNGSIVTFYSEGKSLLEGRRKESAMDTVDDGCNVRKDEFADARGEAIQCFLREFQSVGSSLFGFPIVFDGPHIEVLDVNIRSQSIHRSGLLSIVQKSSSPCKKGRQSDTRPQSEPSKEEHSDMHLVVDSTSTGFQVLASSVVKSLEEADAREIGKRVQNHEEVQLQLEGSTRTGIMTVEQANFTSGVHQVSLDGQKYWLKLGEQVDQEVENRKALCEDDSIRGVPVTFPDFPTVKGILLEDAGPSLDKLAVNPEQVHEMGRQLYVKLQHINEVHKIYHNDISPRNICLKDGIYRLIDWGCASWNDLEATSDLKALAQCCMELLRGNEKFVYAPLRQHIEGARNFETRESSYIA